MSHAGFFEQKRGSPTGLGLVVLAHVAVLGTLVLIKGPIIIRPVNPPTVVDFIEVETDPPPVAQPEIPETRTETRYTQPVREIEIAASDGPTGMTSEIEPVRIVELPGAGEVEIARVELPPPVRREATILSGNLQPPYPPDQQRAERGGLVRLQVHIGPDGRVVSVERLSATNDAFWNATRRHALARWRFRPATIDGRPVESTKTMTVHFRIEDI